MYRLVARVNPAFGRKWRGKEGGRHKGRIYMKMNENESLLVVESKGSRPSSMQSFGIIWQRRIRRLRTNNIRDNRGTLPDSEKRNANSEVE